MPDGPLMARIASSARALEVTHECRRKPAADENARRRVERSELGGVSEAAFDGHEGVLARPAGSDPGPRRTPGGVRSILQVDRKPPRQQPLPGDVRLGRL